MNSNTNNEIPALLIKYYDTIYKIGEGTYGIVYKATTKVGREVVAIKQFKSNSKDEREKGEGISITACREIMLLREVDHENIVKMREVLLNPIDRSLFLIFDFSEYDLYEIIKYHREKKIRPADYSIKSYLWQMINGIHYLHSCWILHRDLKPSNILVMGEGPEVGRIKIADFGLARIFQSPLRPLSDNGVVVTIWYRAPELLLSSNHYSRAIDIWALGCIFAELFLTKPLFAGNPNSVDDQISKIYQILGSPTPERWPGIIDMPDWQKNPAQTTMYPNILKETMKVMYTASENAFDLLSRMIEYDPAKRITAAEALDHPYFQENPLPSMNAFDKSIMSNIPFPIRKAQDHPHQ